MQPASMFEVFLHINVELSVVPRGVSVRVELAVKAWVTVRAPALVVVRPLLPRVSADALVAPSVIVPVVPVAVPVSSVMLPELLVVPNALPVCILILLEFVDAAFVAELATLLAT